MWCFGDHLLHHALDLAQLVHQVHLIMQAACCVNNDDVGIFIDCLLHRLECYGRGVCTHALVHHGHSYPVRPDLQLGYGSSTKCIAGTKQDFFTGFFKLVRQFADGCGFAHAVHANHHNNIRCFFKWCFKIGHVRISIFLQQCSYLLLQDGIQLGSTKVFILCNPFFYPSDDL